MNNQQNQFLSFKSNGQFTDVILKCKDGNINCHRMILSANCDYFYRMFTCNLKESESNEVRFNDTCVNVMEVIIAFLYDDNMPEEMLSDELLIEEVLKHAHMFQLDKLFQQCFIRLIALINDSNTLRIWDLAERYEQREYCSKVMQFVVENFTKTELHNVMSGLTSRRMTSVIVKISSNNGRMSFILQWAKENPEQRLNVLKQILDRSDLNLLSTQYVTDIVLNNNFLTQHAEIRNLFISNMADRLLRNVQIIIYSSSKHMTQMFSFRDKQWLQPIKFALSNTAVCPLYSSKAELFWFNVKDFAIFCKGTWYPGPTSGCNNRTTMFPWASRDKFIYILNDNNIFIRFDSDVNLWTKLATPTGEPSSPCKMIVARIDKVFIMKMNKIFTYDVINNIWHFETDVNVNFKPIMTACFQSNCKCKLYFCQTHSPAISIFDPETRAWTEKLIERQPSQQIFYVNCNNFILFCDIRSNRFSVYNLKTNKFELIPAGQTPDIMSEPFIFLCCK